MNDLINDVNSLTILLPTQNRPSLLRRTLDFYENESLPYKIYVYDSSDLVNKIKVKKIIGASNLNLEFIDYPFGVTLSEKYEKTLNFVESDYVLLIADDDFIFYDAISECLKFLKLNPSYSAASGRAYLFTLDTGCAYGEITKVVSYPQLAFEKDSSEHRFKSHMNNWTTTAYSVQKTKNFKDVISFHGPFLDDMRMKEIHWYATNIIRGKIANLDIPYMFRQTNTDKEWHADSILDWTESLCFPKKKKLLINELAKELVNNGSKSYSYYLKVCEKAFNVWIKARHPLSLKNCFDYSMSYYWAKFKEKTGLNILVRNDLGAVERIKLAVSRQGIEI